MAVAPFTHILNRGIYMYILYVYSGEYRIFLRGAKNFGRKAPPAKIFPPLSFSGGDMGGRGDRRSQEEKNQVTYQNIGI